MNDKIKERKNKGLFFFSNDKFLVVASYPFFPYFDNTLIVGKEEFINGING